ncbi:hypothetical protein O4H49_20195 [Kiloniella laminariae]|uniref:Uncharacterized protein n=1 Tax=Kiloniella laminariae TaxID=454162 RepID=A0ABT4LPQ7_9PROT|nr:hypothetical protein [Kiloniella laminariae]MCZ4283117.1 hypothetical protein [Kiloniella laminariae]
MFDFEIFEDGDYRDKYGNKIRLPFIPRSGDFIRVGYEENTIEMAEVLAVILQTDIYKGEQNSPHKILVKCLPDRLNEISPHISKRAYIYENIEEKFKGISAKEFEAIYKKLEQSISKNQIENLYGHGNEIYNLGKNKVEGTALLNLASDLINQTLGYYRNSPLNSGWSGIGNWIS